MTSSTTDFECRKCVKGVKTEGTGTFAKARLCFCKENCSKCNNVGYLFKKDDKGYSYSEPCICQRLKQRIRLFNEATIPAIYHKKTLDNFDHTNIENGINYIRKLYSLQKSFSPKDKGIGFTGNVGSGKTHLMAGLFHFFTLSLGIPSIFIEFTHLLAEIKKGYGQGRNQDELIAPIAEIPILGIDELGKGRGSDWELTIIDEIISKRYNQNLSTFFTTNYFVQEPDKQCQDYDDVAKNKATKETLNDRLGDRIMSRLTEMCQFYELLSDDYRQKAASKIVQIQSKQPEK